MKAILAILILLFVTCNAHAAWFGLDKFLQGLIKTEFSLVKQDIQGDMNGIKGDVTGISAKMEKLIEATVTLNSKIEAQANVIAGVNNSISKIGNNNNINDADLMKHNITLWQTTCGALILLMGTFIRLYFKSEDKAKFYMTQLSLRSNPEEWKEIMKLKKSVKKEQKEKEPCGKN